MTGCFVSLYGDLRKTKKKKKHFIIILAAYSAPLVAVNLLHISIEQNILSFPKKKKTKEKRIP